MQQYMESLLGDTNQPQTAEGARETGNPYFTNPANIPLSELKALGERLSPPIAFSADTIDVSVYNRFNLYVDVHYAPTIREHLSHAFVEENKETNQSYSRCKLPAIKAHFAAQLSLHAFDFNAPLVITSKSHNLNTLDATTGERLHKFTGHQAPVSCTLRLQHDYFISGDLKGRINGWQIPQESDRAKQAHTPEFKYTYHQHEITAITPLDSVQFFSADRSGVVCLWQDTSLAWSISLNRPIHSMISNRHDATLTIVSHTQQEQSYQLELLTFSHEGQIIASTLAPETLSSMQKMWHTKNPPEKSHFLISPNQHQFMAIEKSADHFHVFRYNSQPEKPHLYKDEQLRMPSKNQFSFFDCAGRLSTVHNQKHLVETQESPLIVHTL